MTISFNNRQDKTESIDLIQRLLQTFVFHGVRSVDREAILNHLTWLRQQKDTMHINCRLETVPELRLTRVTLEVGFQPMKKIQ